MASSSKDLPTDASSSNVGSEAVLRGDQHNYRRVFIGPMPEKVISLTEAQLRKTKQQMPVQGVSADVNDEDETLSQLVKDQAYSFFIHQGGNADDWGETEETRTVEEMHKRWRDSEWGRILLRRKKEHGKPSQWVGSSFEVGIFLGVNTINHSTANIARDRKDQDAEPSSAVVVKSPSLPVLRSIAAERNAPNSASSSTPLLPPTLDSRKARSTSDMRAAALKPGFRFTQENNQADITFNKPDSYQGKGKGKAKVVHYRDPPVESFSPALPADVLGRTGSAIEDTSAGATIGLGGDDESELLWGDVVMRDRMFVRVCFTKLESLGSSFNETQHRTTRHLHYEDWAEHMVVWRKDCIEIYEDHFLPFKEWITGRKNLVFIIPLKSFRTHLSMYSFVDLTFCITCPPATVTGGDKKGNPLIHQTKDGTNIFIFKVRSRTRALDWVWKLWRYLGGQIPPSIEIRNPGLDTRVRIDIPQEQADQPENSTVFARENIIKLCTAALGSVPDWYYLIQRQIEEGKSLELAWRMDTQLDWVWQDECVDGTRRRWAVLSGLPLKQKCMAPSLEVRLALHYPTSLYMPDGTLLTEPPAIEGYLDRIVLASQGKWKPLYIATHNGNIFFLYPARAHPPPPPGLHALVRDDTPTLPHAEARRGAMQITDAYGVMDLTDILVVRRAFHLVPQQSHNEIGNHRGKAKNEGDGEQVHAALERFDSDDDDEGGSEALAKASDKPKLKMMRSFELLLKNGHVVRFETHSRRVALEWIERLRALIFYWAQRRRIDAREEMDLAHSLRAPITPPMHVCSDDCDLPPQTPPDPSALLPALGSLYNWCVLGGCKSIVKGGRVFVRRGFYGPYKSVQMFLVSGRLILFHVIRDTSLHRRQPKTVSLLDAYIFSGYFAALTLPEGQYNPTSSAVPRRYQDGLEAADPEEDMLFMIWYRRQKLDVNTTTDNPVGDIPVPKKLSVKRKVITVRARSKLERDAWCWAINCEIEKLVRLAKAREDKLRETGGLVNI